MRRVYPFLSLVIVAAAVSFAVSSRRHTEQPLPQPCSLESLSSYLSLSPGQQRQLAPVFAELAQKRTEILERRDKAAKHLVAVSSSENPDRQQVDAALAAVDVEQARLRSLAAHHLLHLKRVLNEEQEKKLFDLVNRRLCITDGQGSIACPGAGQR